MLQKIKNIFAHLFLKTKKIHPLFWLFLLILIPINFFCFKEKWERQKNSSGWDLAFELPDNQPSENQPLEKITNFYLSTQNSQKRSCQIETLFNNQKLNEQKVSLKKEKKDFSLPEDILSEIRKEAGGKLEIRLQCGNYQDNIYKYLSL